MGTFANVGLVFIGGGIGSALRYGVASVALSIAGLFAGMALARAALAP